MATSSSSSSGPGEANGRRRVERGETLRRSPRAAGRGKIVNVSSLAGRVPGPLLGLYAASKHAVEAMSDALCFEAAHFGVQVTILEPGMFRSDWQTGNLDVCAAVREGRSTLQAVTERTLAGFRALAASRPRSGSVGMAIADVVEL